MVELEKIKITDILPADYNPRRMGQSEFLKLSNSINEFGIVDPLIINLKNNHLIGGHQRYEVLLDKFMKDNNFMEELNLLRLGDIGWAFPSTDLTVKSEDHEKALNLALNKISGEWDLPKLEPLLTELNLSGFDIDLTGFSDIELTELTLESDLLYADENTELDSDLDLEEIYDEPVKDMLQCPKCDHIDVVKRFKKVDG